MPRMKSPGRVHDKIVEYLAYLYHSVVIFMMLGWIVLDLVEIH